MGKGKKLRGMLLERKGMEVQDLADHLELNAQIIHNRLKGRTSFTFEEAIKIADLLGIKTVEELKLLLPENL